ncbi:hypothetical protein [Streptomyces daliensis]|uniref:Hydrogenase expression protein HypF n=1 Tax=Streptomyces daliensis TaxID=299421 RepID=A0A8T4IMR9_9ACTN|nr:hypothetical protein [Streptomyces daliensis]
MPGDEVHEEAGASAGASLDAVRVRTGPRHAAPKKPLLTRLHVPAGKAIAIAAMPSAVLMGMGLTPQLANAKPLPKNPFKSGPCVSQQDKEEAEQEKEAEEKAAKAAKEKAAKAKAAKEKAAEEKADEEKAKKDGASGSSDSGSDSGSGSEESGSTGSGSGSDSSSGSDDSTTEPEPEPSESEKAKNPLDPLGLGDKIKDAFTPDEEKEESASEETTAPESTEEESSSTEKKSGSDVGKAAEDTVNKVEDGVKDTTDKVGESAEKAAKDAKDATDKLGKSASSEETNKTAEDEDGKKAFPCVEEKKVDGKDEQTQVTLPNDPWTLESSKLSLHGLNYEGVVNVSTANGSQKQALKFTADSIDIGDLHQIVEGPGGTRYHVEAAKGSNSTITGGKVTMYTESLKGNLFGLIPITFDPEHPPPLNIPEAMFTKVTVKQAGQFGGNLTVPGLHQYVGK